jgi:hypothetical protein
LAGFWEDEVWIVISLIANVVLAPIRELTIVSAVATVALFAPTVRVGHGLVATASANTLVRLEVLSFVSAFALAEIQLHLVLSRALLFLLSLPDNSIMLEELLDRSRSKRHRYLSFHFCWQAVGVALKMAFLNVFGGNIPAIIVRCCAFQDHAEALM